MATEAQIAANRRNSQKSTGPRSELGKARSRLNALDHGGRALLPVLPTEESGEYEARCQSWIESFQPRNPSEELLIERLVMLDLQWKRINRAHIARVSKRMYFGLLEEEANVAAEVIELGSELFRDTSDPDAQDRCEESRAAIASGKTRSDEDSFQLEMRPRKLVHNLQTTGAGCQWLLDQWAALRDLLDRGVPWLASDTRKAVRLLGGQLSIAALHEREVACVYLASHVILNQGGGPFQDILNQFPPDRAKAYENSLRLREYHLLAPKDAAAARKMLLKIIDETTAELEEKAEMFRELAELDAQSASGRLSWDDTDEGERLRRYEITCTRAWQRTYDMLLHVRRTGHELDLATVKIMRRQAPHVDMSALDAPAPAPAPAAATVMTPPTPPVKRPEPPSEPNSDRAKLPNEANSPVPAPTTQHRRGDKAFRIDSPATASNGGGTGKITGNEKIHAAMRRLETGHEPPLLNLAPIFGKQ